jgi:hypothetical protein
MRAALLGLVKSATDSYSAFVEQFHETTITELNEAAFDIDEGIVVEESPLPIDEENVRIVVETLRELREADKDDEEISDEASYKRRRCEYIQSSDDYEEDEDESD